uniref:Calpain catalytic domain-containing protein n=1 Tax=Macrostomum lignano TaxID=282301 RepID=A0A1I8FJG7_9PLAT
RAITATSRNAGDYLLSAVHNSLRCRSLPTEPLASASPTSNERIPCTAAKRQRLIIKLQQAAEKASSNGPAAGAAASGDGADPRDQSESDAVSPTELVGPQLRAAAQGGRNRWSPGMLQPPAEAKHRLAGRTAASVNENFDSKSGKAFALRTLPDAHSQATPRPIATVPMHGSIDSCVPSRRWLYAKRNNRWIGSFHQQLFGLSRRTPASCWPAALLHGLLYSRLRQDAVTKALLKAPNCSAPETYTWHCLRTICPIRRSGRYLGPGASLSELQVRLGHGSANSCRTARWRECCPAGPYLLGHAWPNWPLEFARLSSRPECARRIRVRFCLMVSH